MNDKPVATLENSQLYKSDLDLFDKNSNQWTTDNCIHFFFEYLALRKYASYNIQRDIVLFDPWSTQILLHEDDGECIDDMISNNLNAKAAKILIIPIVDALLVELAMAPAGSHWTLLLGIKNGRHASKQDNQFHDYCFDTLNTDGNKNLKPAGHDVYNQNIKNSDTYDKNTQQQPPPINVNTQSSESEEWLWYHLDSNCSMKSDSNNAQLAFSLLLKIYPFLKSTSITSTKGIKINKIPTTQQNNSYDCGRYVMAFAEQILKMSIPILQQHNHVIDIESFVQKVGIINETHISSVSNDVLNFCKQSSVLSL